MCIVIYKPKGVAVIDDLFDACFTSGERNGDGIGIAIKRSKANVLELAKGLYTSQSFIEYMKGLLITVDDEFLFHARIRTHGDVSETNCHPFIMSSNEEVLDTIFSRVVKLPVLAHNGAFSDFCEFKSTRSDTYNFTKNLSASQAFVDSLREINSINDPDNKLSKLIFGSWNKVAIMYPEQDKNTVLFGNFTQDLGGCWFSNTSYINFKRHVDTTIQQGS